MQSNKNILSKCCNEEFGLYINNIKQGFCSKCNKLSKSVYVGGYAWVGLPSPSNWPIRYSMGFAAGNIVILNNRFFVLKDNGDWEIL